MVGILTRLFGKKITSGAPQESRSYLPYKGSPYSLENYIHDLESVSNPGSGIDYFEIDTATNVRKALDECPPVAYIVNKKARAFCSGVTTAIDKKTGNPVAGVKAWYQAIMDKPNFLQTGYQFTLQNYAQMQSHGYSVCLKIMVAGQVSSIWALPNELVHIEWDLDWKPFKRLDIRSAIRSISFCDAPLDKKDVFIFTDSTAYVDNMLLPTTRLKPLKYPINNLIINFESRGRLMNKPMGVLSSAHKDNISGMDLDPGDIDKLHRDMDKYGLTKTQKRFVITNASLSWQPMSFPLIEMQMDIFERNDTITIAEGMDYPPFLLGISEKGIYNNVSEAYKGLYTGSIIPDSVNYSQQLDQMMGVAEDSVTYKIDYSHLSVLQEGLKAKNEARKILGEAISLEFEKNMITYGRMMELMDEKNYNEAWKELYYYQMPYNQQQEKQIKDGTE